MAQKTQQAKKKTVILQGEPKDTLQEKVIRHAAIGVGVALVSLAVDYALYLYKTKK